MTVHRCRCGARSGTALHTAAELVAVHIAGDDGSFVGGNGSIAAVTDKALLSLLDEVRLSGGPRRTIHHPCRVLVTGDARCTDCFRM
jgi:hypothetical protein